ncbi:hypothetical protein B4N89_02405 [Embleya scabrispora]|uniref:DUF2637 domain-containing protein n=1 Tax=Embleya scabrispora TaxID=159449 RepID=A0A1T3NSZ4_9ACTN|nr:DUF2637 domain-containing protein [Embleya scabrispora]OPC79949.1 hypothetical protein B4N89_02405 [Embleya scabrispora]
MADAHLTSPPPAHAGGAGDPLLALALLAAAVTIVLTAATMWLSYEHLHDVAVAHGLGRSTARAWAWPATIDLFIVLGEILILRASLARRGVALAVALTIAGAGGSIALNVAGVGGGASPMDYTVAAVPPVASLLAFGCLMWQIHGWVGRRAAAAGATLAMPASAPLTAAELPPPPPLSAPARPTVAPPTPAPAEPPAPPAAPTYADPRCAVIHAMYADGTRPSAPRMVAALHAAGWPGLSESTAKNLRALVEQDTALRGLPAAI